MHFILPQLYDIRPRTPEGELDMKRMRKTQNVIDLRTRASNVVERVPAAVSRSRAQERFYSGTFIASAPLQSPGIPAQTFPTIVHVQSALSEEYAPRAVAVMQHKARIKNSARPLLVALLVLSLVFPGVSAWQNAMATQRSILASVGEAVGKIQVATAAIMEMDVDRAAQTFSEAADDFQTAKEQLSSVGFGVVALLAKLPVSTQLTTGEAVIGAGGHLAAAGEHLTAALRLFQAFSPEALVAMLVVSPQDAQDSQPTLGTVPDVKQELVEGADELASAAGELERIDLAAIPEQYRQQASSARDAIPKIRETAEAIRGSAATISGIFGMEGKRRYLVLLQNSAELRPTGGFTGNLGILTMEHGTIQDLRIEDVYLFDGQLARYTEPPKPIQEISAAWSLHDANWFRDFPTSATVAAHFFEETGQETPDGVIALTSKLFERLLAAVGPVQTPDGLHVDATTFTDTLNAIGASQRPGETTQVRAVASVLPALLAKLSQNDPAARVRVVETMRQSIQAGDLQVWFRNADEEKLVDRLGISGRLPDSRGDFLAVVHANINGFKTDKVITEHVNHEARIASDGSVIDTVTITREHHGNARSEPWYRNVNKTYTRLLVPRGATLLAAEGFICKVPESRIDYSQAQYRVYPAVAEAEQTLQFHEDACVFVGEETGKTVFGGWAFVSPGETLTLRVSYRLPFSVNAPVDSYRLVVVKQPGWEPIFSTAVYPDVAWQTAWHDEALTQQFDGAFVSAPEAFLKNRFFGIVLKKANSQ